MFVKKSLFFLLGFFLILNNNAYAFSSENNMSVLGQGPKPSAITTYYTNNYESFTNSLNGLNEESVNNSTTTTKINYTAWQLSMSKIAAPHAGCFSVKYPNTAWQQIQCTKPPLIPPLPSNRQSQASKPLLDTVGGGGFHPSVAASRPTNDDNTRTLIQQSLGRFLPASVQGETDSLVGPNYQNEFSLQMNSNAYASVSSQYTDFNLNYKYSWVQFVFDNDPKNGAGTLFVVYWLYDYAHLNGGKCPTNGGPPSGSSWSAFTISCYAYGPVTSVPTQIVQNLANLHLVGSIDSGFDLAEFCVLGDCYLSQSTDQVLNLSQNWFDSEFNIFGLGNGSTAIFDDYGAVIYVLNILYPPSPPDTTIFCKNTGTTAETNNLYIINGSFDPQFPNNPNFANPCILDGPGMIEFLETNTNDAPILYTGVNSGQGSVDPVCPQSEGGCAHLQGDSVTVTGTPSPGWLLTYWTSGTNVAPCVTNSCTFNMPSNYVEMYANFVQQPSGNSNGKILLCSKIHCSVEEVPWTYVISPFPPASDKAASFPTYAYLDNLAYDHNSVITLHGHVNNQIPGQDVILSVIDPSGNIVNASKISVENNGNFTTIINTASPKMSNDGIYSIYAQPGNQVSRTYELQFVLTQTIPEFGSIVGVIIVISIFGSILLSRKFTKI